MFTNLFTGGIEKNINNTCSSTRKDSGGGILTSVILGEAEYSSYGKEAGSKTRQRVIEAVGNRATGRNHY
jgi:hypothetical protein